MRFYLFFILEFFPLYSFEIIMVEVTSTLGMVLALSETKSLQLVQIRRRHPCYHIVFARKLRLPTLPRQIQ